MRACFASIICAVGALGAALPATASAQANDGVDPLTAFKKVVASCEARANEHLREQVREKDGKWGRIVVSPAVVKFDVRRTDSLVSPLTGYITVEVVDQLVQRPTEEEVRGATLENASALARTYQLRYAFQESHWTFAGGSFASKIKLGREARFDDLGSFAVTSDGLRRNERLAGCLP